MKIGKKTWAFAGGFIPLHSQGHEPENTSHERLSVLNTSSDKAVLNLTLYYEDKDPIGPYEIEVEAKRTKTFRFNDLIDPEAMPLETHYSVVIESDVAVIIQFGRLDTSSGNRKELGFVPYSE